MEGHIGHGAKDGVAVSEKRRHDSGWGEAIGIYQKEYVKFWELHENIKTNRDAPFAHLQA
jgi:hypothetical protein